MQHRDLALGAVDGIVDQVELDLELFALLDLGAVGFQKRMRFRDLARSALLEGLPIWARIARSSDMISRCMGPTSASVASWIGACTPMASSIRKRLR
jgi:hypothetical protein